MLTMNLLLALIAISAFLVILPSKQTDLKPVRVRTNNKRTRS